MKCHPIYCLYVECCGKVPFFFGRKLSAYFFVSFTRLCKISSVRNKKNKKIQFLSIIGNFCKKTLITSKFWQPSHFIITLFPLITAPSFMYTVLVEIIINRLFFVSIIYFLPINIITSWLSFSSKTLFPISSWSSTILLNKTKMPYSPSLSFSESKSSSKTSEEGSKGLAQRVYFPELRDAIFNFMK